MTRIAYSHTCGTPEASFVPRVTFSITWGTSWTSYVPRIAYSHTCGTPEACFVPQITFSTTWGTPEACFVPRVTFSITWGTSGASFVPLQHTLSLRQNKGKIHGLAAPETGVYSGKEDLRSKHNADSAPYFASAPHREAT